MQRRAQWKCALNDTGATARTPRCGSGVRVPQRRYELPEPAV
jgi:hypothetical protein